MQKVRIYLNFMYNSLIAIVATEAPVEDTTVKITSPTAVEVSWKPPDRMYWNGKIDQYAITTMRYIPNELSVKRQEPVVEIHNVQPTVNNPDPSLAEEPLKIEVHSLTGLEEYFEYSFSVAIINEGGIGVTSVPMTQVMPQAG